MRTYIHQKLKGKEATRKRGPKCKAHFNVPLADTGPRTQAEGHGSLEVIVSVLGWRALEPALRHETFRVNEVEGRHAGAQWVCEDHTARWYHLAGNESPSLSNHAGLAFGKRAQSLAATFVLYETEVVNRQEGGCV